MTPPPSSGTFSLTDRYRVTDGEILVSGIHALVRIPFDQIRADRRAGHRTAAFVSGYQGSPLGGYDMEFQSQRALADEFGIVHQPGLNEELAATAVMGSQLASTFERRTYEGVVGIWYGKAPGLDRAGDAIRHANWAGTARLGGVLALVGDDPACKSSTLPSRSDASLIGLGLPVLAPGTVQDVLDLGMHGIALSRSSGAWVSMKIVTSVADGASTARVEPGRVTPVLPDYEVNGQPWLPTITGRLLPPHTSTLEVDVIGHRVEYARRYIVANRLNTMVVDPTDAWVGIVALGHTFEMVREALGRLGLDDRELERRGVRLLKLTALNPFDGEAIGKLARGVSTLLVIEDKLALIETLVRDVLYGRSDPPRVLGKMDETGAPLIPHLGALTADSLVEPIRRVLSQRLGDDVLASLHTGSPLRLTLKADAVRTPYFCSGCPHNTGLKVPDDALVGGGIGCHGMVDFMPADRRGELIGNTQMGGEGSQWIGIAPFVEDDHLFQNIGDGTFFHSGQLSVQAAIAAGMHMTFKLLYNAAVAMTGGQDAAGLLSPAAIAAKLRAEGVEGIIITTDDPKKYRGTPLPDGVRVLHRDEIVAAQNHLRSLPGVTVLIHDQQCAAEKRRDRKRGILKQPEFRIVIDERVCEGCGDCGVKSNCLSLQPHDTEFGRKTIIDQGSCNLDVSCLKGDCPAFITVTKTKGAGSATPPRGSSSIKDLAGQLQEPIRVIDTDGVTIRMPGIGGTGVVTICQLLGAAAKIDGLPAHSVDQTGLSQKAGPVVSTITFGAPTFGGPGVLLGFDLLVAVSPANVLGLDPAVSIVVASTSVTPTARMIGNVATSAIDVAALRVELDSRSRAEHNVYLDGFDITRRLVGDAVTANVLMLGVAYQTGVLPVSAASLEAAIELNGTAVQRNLDSFRWGRLWVVDPEAVHAAAGLDRHASELDDSAFEDIADPVLRRSVAIRADELASFQNTKLAKRYVADVRRVIGAETAGGGDGRFSAVVAHQLHRLMAYKDEYEVARLLLDGRRRVAEQFGQSSSPKWNLHPPMLRSMGMKNKLKLGRWATPLMIGLRAGRRLRGTPFDPFGRAHVRKEERLLIVEYRALIDELLPLLAGSAPDRERAITIAGLVDMVRGYESVKQRNLERYRTLLSAELSSLHLS